MGNRNMKTRMREMAGATLSGLGLVGVSELRVLAAAVGTGAPYSYWQEWAGPEFFHTDLETALGLCTGNLNETLLVSPESHPQADAVTWDKSITHCVGMYGPAFMNHRSRIGHSVTVSPLLTVSGSGCTFANLYFPYGLANATDLNLLTVSGNRNSFINCHFLPSDATPLDEAGYALIKISGSETYFKNCFFGGDTVAWTDGDMVKLGTAAGQVPRTIFENCLFVMNADNAQVNFLASIAGIGRAAVIFKGCQFLNLGTALTYAIDGTGISGTGLTLAFDANSYFAGATDVIVAASESHAFFAPASYAANALTNGLGSNPDVS